VSPLREPDADDPLEIVGVVMERPMDTAAIDAMARTFVEEYALLGWEAKRILHLFRLPFYGGAHDAYEALGEDRIAELIEETLDPQEGWRDA
jgi:hypothetical protein